MPPNGTSGSARPWWLIDIIPLSTAAATALAVLADRLLDHKLVDSLGADVIKVEPPEGDWARGLGTQHGDHSAYSLVCNQGKRGIVLDLKADAAGAALWRLIEAADVFAQGFRPGVIDRLGFGYDAVAARMPLPNVIGAPPFADGVTAPALGAHTSEVLREYGFADDVLTGIKIL